MINNIVTNILGFKKNLSLMYFWHFGKSSVDLVSSLNIEKEDMKEIFTYNLNPMLLNAWKSSLVNNQVLGEGIEMSFGGADKDAIRNEYVVDNIEDVLSLLNILKEDYFFSLNSVLESSVVFEKHEKRRILVSGMGYDITDVNRIVKPVSLDMKLTYMKN